MLGRLFGVFGVGLTDLVVQDASATDPQKQIQALKREVQRLQTQNKLLQEAIEKNGIILTDAHQSIVTILKELPPDLDPQKKDWEQYDWPKVTEWLKQEPIGKPFEAVLILSEISVDRNRYAADPSYGWSATLRFRTFDFRLGKRTFRQEIRLDPMKYSGDEDFARRMEKVNTGRKVKVKGKIRSVTVGSIPGGKPQLGAVITLGEYDLDF